MCNVVHNLIHTYIGVPYMKRGRMMEGLDCYGLVMHVYDSFFGNGSLPDFIYENNSSVLFAKEFHKHIHKISMEDAVVGDLVVFKLGCDAPIGIGIPEVSSSGAVHMGVYLGGGRFLHSARGVGVVQGSVGDKQFIDRLIGVFKIKKCE